MKYDLTFNRFWETIKNISVLNREVEVYFISEDYKEMAPTERQIKLLDSLDNLPVTIIEQLNEWARKYYRKCMVDWQIPGYEIMEDFGFEIDEANIQNHYGIGEVVIPRIQSCTDKYVFLTGGCGWDIEHGIEFLLKNGTPIQCTAQEGLCLNKGWDKYIN